MTSNMQTLRRSAVVAAIGCALAGVGLSQARGTTIVSWSFNGQNLASDGATDLEAAGQLITSSGLTNPTPNAIAGVAFATKGPSGSSSDFYLRAGIGNGGTETGSNEGGFIQWSANTIGLQGTTVSWFADTSSATSGAFQTETLEYNDGLGGGWQTAAAEALPTSFQAISSPLSVNVGTLDSSIDNNSNAMFRIVFTGSTNYNGPDLTGNEGTGGPNARVDNLTVSAVAAPEPASIGLAGIGALGLLGRRRRSSI